MHADVEPGRDAPRHDACSRRGVIADLYPLEFRCEALLQTALLLAAAFLLALPVGWDREQAGRSAGLRTFPLVSLSSCAFLLIGQLLFERADQARVFEGLVTGIGFVGGGAILKSGNYVRGTATAASIWTTGAIGAASAYGRLDVAVLLSVVTFATLRWLHVLDGGPASGRERDYDDERAAGDPDGS